MFEIDENNLPIVRTRQAILILDLQNDFISTSSPLQVEEPSDLVGNVVNLVSHFRSSGKVIWVRSVFERSRAVNLIYGDSEQVITDEEVAAHAQKTKRLRPSHKVLAYHEKSVQLDEKELAEPKSLEVDDEESSSVSEAFLTVEPGHEPQYVLNATIGVNFVDPVTQTIEGEKDLIFSKTHYSAFKDGSLVQILRSRMITELYICGALTNISVFATAMDAPRHGYSITILEDCLGYRSKTRHDEAVRQLIEYTGCDIISSVDLIRDMKKKAEKTKAQKAAPKQNQRPRQTNISLENLMSNLNLKRDSSAPSGTGAAKMSQSLLNEVGKGRKASTTRESRVHSFEISHCNSVFKIKKSRF